MDYNWQKIYCLIILSIYIEKFDIFKTRRLEYRQNEGEIKHYIAIRKLFVFQ